MNGIVRGEKRISKTQTITNLIETPKHLMATAASKNTAAFGNVSCAIVKKDAFL
jgi:hypothetical protein